MSTGIVFQNRNQQVAVEIDHSTGLPTSLIVEGIGVPLSVGARLITGGREVEGQPFGIDYADTIEFADFELVSTDIRYELADYAEIFTVRTHVSEWLIEWEYRIRQRSPRLEIQWIVTPASGASTVTLRNLHLTVKFNPNMLDDWIVEAPGSEIRPGLSMSDLNQTVQVSDPAWSGSGMVIAHQPMLPQSIVIWPLSKTEQLRSQIQTESGAFLMTIETGLAARLEAADHLRYGSLELDAFDLSWDEIRPQIAAWFPVVGIASPADTPAWVSTTTIFEVQIGTSRFWNGWEYSPYPTMRDLYNDLGRIAGLGFSCIQIMPRQPFPSYNVYDYSDVSMSYGDEADLIELVAAAHALGIRVILDILMHGVIDAEIIHQTADRVRNGPYFDRLNERTDRQSDLAFDGYHGDDYLVAWSRHILDFENDWAAGSPGSHPLADEHPEWFMRNSEGAIIGIYTKAFDVANLAWQQYFTKSALELVRRLGIDGFRFDAPTYNSFPNWSTATEKRASASELGTVPYFQQFRYEMRRVEPEAVMYTEPSGILFRQSMDITYNYDEHWLFHAVLRPESALKHNLLGVRDARDLALWFRDKLAALPRGSITAHHIDSHDSFWWPLPGYKWRREQYGFEATRAILAVWSLSGGVYMTFVGGEIGIEEDLRRVHRLRRELPEIRFGDANFDAISIGDRGIYALVRVDGAAISLLLVNLTNDAITTTMNLDINKLGVGPTSVWSIVDSWTGDVWSHLGEYLVRGEALNSFELTFAPYQVRVLTLRSKQV